MPLVPHHVPLGSRDKVAVGLALAHHFLTIGIEGVVDDPLGGVLLVVVLETEVAEALSDGLQSRSLGLVPERIIGIRAIHNLAEQDESRVTSEVVLLEDGLKRTLLAVMAQFHIFHVIGDRPFAFCHLQHLVGWHKEKLSIFVHKFFNQPGAGHTVYLDVFTSNPLHCMVLLLVASTCIDSETNEQRRKTGWIIPPRVPHRRRRDNWAERHRAAAAVHRRPWCALPLRSGSVPRPSCCACSRR